MTWCLACGVRSTDETSDATRIDAEVGNDAPPEMDAGDPSDASEADGSVESGPARDVNPGTVDRAGEFDAGALAICRDYLTIWKVRQAEVAAKDAGMACKECIERSEVRCIKPAGVECEPGNACMLRHCLCTRATAPTCLEDDYPEEFCGCMASCFPPGPGFCKSAWMDFMACAVAECGTDCR